MILQGLRIILTITGNYPGEKSVGNHVPSVVSQLGTRDIQCNKVTGDGISGLLAPLREVFDKLVTYVVGGKSGREMANQMVTDVVSEVQTSEVSCVRGMEIIQVCTIPLIASIEQICDDLRLCCAYVLIYAGGMRFRKLLLKKCNRIKEILLILREVPVVGAEQIC